MRVEEKSHSISCEHCGQDHKEWLCPNEQYLYPCKGCGHPLEFDEGEYCMPCQVDMAENQGFRWGEYR